MARKLLNAKRLEAVNPLQARGPRPGDYALGSLQSRAAARSMLERLAEITSVLIFTGLPGPSIGNTSSVEAPDTLERYLAQDGSIVHVICREWEPGKFTAFIDQTWPDGSVYQGNCPVQRLTDLEELKAYA